MSFSLYSEINSVYLQLFYLNEVWFNLLAELIHNRFIQCFILLLNLATSLKDYSDTRNNYIHNKTIIIINLDPWI